jgi:4-oxalocrotonate tautomerase family enzyme
MRSGRSIEQVRDLVDQVTDAVVRTAKVTPDRVRVLVHELEADRIAVGGKLASDAAPS